MKYETIGGVPTQGMAYAKLLDLLNQAQDQAYVLAHLTRAMGGPKDSALADGWISVGELLKRQIHMITKLAMGKMQ